MNFCKHLGILFESHCVGRGLGLVEQEAGATNDLFVIKAAIAATAFHPTYMTLSKFYEQTRDATIPVFENSSLGKHDPSIDRAKSR